MKTTTSGAHLCCLACRKTLRLHYSAQPPRFRICPKCGERILLRHSPDAC